MSDADILRVQDIKDRQTAIETDAKMLLQKESESLQNYLNLKNKVETEAASLKDKLTKINNDRIDVDVLKQRKAEKDAGKILTMNERLQIQNNAKSYLLNAGIKPMSEKYEKVMTYVRGKVDKNEAVTVNKTLLQELEISPESMLYN